MQTTFRTCALALACASLASVGNAQGSVSPKDGITWADLLGKGSRVQLYGFLRLDQVYDTDRFNNPKTPYYVRSPDASPDNKNSEYAMHSRLSRLGLTVDGKQIKGLGNPKLSGKVEVDFYNSGVGDSDSRNALRMRLGYLGLNWGSWSVLAGQDWDVISPLMPAVNHDTVMWYNGNLGDRRPQLTAKNVTEVGAGNQVITEFGLALTGAVGGTSTDPGLVSGEASGRPMLNARVGYHGKAKNGPYQFGVWGHQAEERYDATGGGEMDFDSNSLGVDMKFPLFSDSLSFSGEYHTGENMKDVRGGIITGVNATSGMEVSSMGGWGEVAYKLSNRTSLYAGYTFEDPDDDDLSAGGYAKNTVPYVAARWNFEDLKIGLEYLKWSTEYIGMADGDADRVVLWISYYF